VNEIILYYDARSKKHQNFVYDSHIFATFSKKEERNLLSFKVGYRLILTFVHKVDIHGVMKYNLL